MIQLVRPAVNWPALQLAYVPAGSEDFVRMHEFALCASDASDFLVDDVSPCIEVVYLCLKPHEPRSCCLLVVTLFYSWFIPVTCVPWMHYKSRSNSAVIIVRTIHHYSQICYLHGTSCLSR